MGYNYTPSTRRLMRAIDKLLIYSEANPDLAPEQIRNYHSSRGLMDIGYHYCLNVQGVLRVGRRADSPAAPPTLDNERAITVCLLGRIDIDYAVSDLEKLAGPLSDLCIAYGLYAKDIKIAPMVSSLPSYNLQTLRDIVQDTLDGTERGYYVY